VAFKATEMGMTPAKVRIEPPNTVFGDAAGYLRFARKHQGPVSSVRDVMGLFEKTVSQNHVVVAVSLSFLIWFPCS